MSRLKPCDVSRNSAITCCQYAVGRGWRCGLMVGSFRARRTNEVRRSNERFCSARCLRFCGMQQDTQLHCGFSVLMYRDRRGFRDPLTVTAGDVALRSPLDEEHGFDLIYSYGGLTSFLTRSWLQFVICGCRRSLSRGI